MPSAKPATAPLMQCDIQYDYKSGEKVTYSNFPAKTNHGDQIKFTSNNSDTAINFKNGSPFNSSGSPEPILIGTEKVLTVEKPGKQHFECGTMPAGKPFVSWGGAGGDIP